MKLVCSDHAEWIDQAVAAADFDVHSLKPWNSMLNTDLYLGDATQIIGFDRIADTYQKYRVLGCTIFMKFRLHADAAVYTAFTPGFYVYMYAQEDGALASATPPPWAAAAGAEAAGVGLILRSKQIMHMKRDPRSVWAYFPPVPVDGTKKSSTRSLRMKTNLVYQTQQDTPAQVHVATTLHALVNSPPTPVAPTSIRHIQWGVIMDDTADTVPALEFCVKQDKYMILFNRHASLIT